MVRVWIDPVLIKSDFHPFCEQLPSHVKIRYSQVKLDDADISRKRKGKGKEVENDTRTEQLQETSQENRLATLDIFAGCGGLSEGLHQSGNFSLLATKYNVTISPLGCLS